jgi:hypothetical protein
VIPSLASPWPDHWNVGVPVWGGADPRNLPMTMGSAPLLFEEATNADGVWRLVVRSSDGVVGRIFRVVGECGYFAIDAFTVTFRDPNLRTPQEADRRRQAMSP